MDLTGLHILLTYKCNYECDHCFVWGSPWQTGVFRLSQLEEVYLQALEVGTVRQIYFEGGEPFLYYPILVKAVARAKELGFWVGIVSNSYWATSVEDALEWVRPLVKAGLDTIELSSDLFHGEEMETPEFTRASLRDFLHRLSRSYRSDTGRTAHWRRCHVSRSSGSRAGRRRTTPTLGLLYYLSL